MLNNYKTRGWPGNGVDQVYIQASQSGRYARPTGLRGKYDNVRRFWEDEVTRWFIRPYLHDLRKKKEKIRICDLGCGCGDGYELLTGPVKTQVALEGKDKRLIPEEMIEIYVGVDINQQLLEQGKNIYACNPKVSFCQGDFLQGLPVREEPPFDLYLANYGTFSHCKDQELVDLLAEIAVQASDGSLLIADWLGCYCYEWQNLWLPEPVPDYMMSYVISYIYDDPEQAEAQAFDLRLMDRETILALVQKAGEKANAEIKVHQFFDRSLFVGRHIETSHYHPDPQPLRTGINSLFELGQETDLEQLLIFYQRRDGFFEINARFIEFKECWNSLVRLTADLLSGKARLLPKTKKAFLTRAMKAMHLLVENVFSFSKHDLKLEEVRASIIEPQLAYLLRGLEINLQQGIGMGHGLGAIMEIKKG